VSIFGNFDYCDQRMKKVTMDKSAALTSSSLSVREGDRIPRQMDSCQVAVVEWIKEQDGLPQVIHYELAQLGYQPLYFDYDAPIAPDVDVVFTFGPYGKFLPIPQKLARLPIGKRPMLVHWNTVGLPDVRLPWPLVQGLGACRSWMGRLDNTENPILRAVAKKLIASWESRILRFRYGGDYYSAYGKGWLNVLADTSAIYAQIHNRHGLPTVVAPWGATPKWYADLDLERDIDVLWIGQRGSGRRGELLDRIRQELRAYGVEIYVADNQENPFIFGAERTRFLNRAKITLNLTRTWYDDNFSRFAMAAPNRSLIISEPLLPHCPQYKSGTHYVSASIDKLAETIMYYLRQEDERLRIVENAYQLVTTELTFRNSIQAIMDAVHSKRFPMAMSNNGVHP
jgi:hypothetical protein